MWGIAPSMDWNWRLNLYTTGHADGWVAFLDDDTLLVADYGLGYFKLHLELSEAMLSKHQHDSLGKLWIQKW